MEIPRDQKNMVSQLLIEVELLVAMSETETNQCEMYQPVSFVIVNFMKQLHSSCQKDHSPRINQGSLSPYQVLENIMETKEGRGYSERTNKTGLSWSIANEKIENELI